MPFWRIKPCLYFYFFTFIQNTKIFVSPDFVWIDSDFYLESWFDIRWNIYQIVVKPVTSVFFCAVLCVDHCFMLMNVDQRGIIGLFSKLIQLVYNGVCMYIWHGSVVNWINIILTGEQDWKVVYKTAGLWVASVMKIHGVLWIGKTVVWWSDLTYRSDNRMLGLMTCRNPVVCCGLAPVCPDERGI